MGTGKTGITYSCEQSHWLLLYRGQVNKTSIKALTTERKLLKASPPLSDTIVR